MSTTTVPRTSDQVIRSQARRAEQLDALGVLWTESKLPRVRKCGRCVVPGNDLGVAIRVTVDAAGNRTAGFGGLESCGSVWVCPRCSAKIAAYRQQELTKALQVHVDRLGGIVAATFTMRHRKGHSLPALWDALAAAWNATIGGNGWIKDQQTWGFVLPRTYKSGDKEGQTTESVRLPVIRVVEVTYGRNGWHVHVHALILTRHQINDATAEVIGERMFSRWKAKLSKLGFEPDDEHGFLATAPTGSALADAFGEYFTKGTYDGTSGAAFDATRADLKGGRSGNRTPFQILSGIAGHTDYQDGDLAVWAEWEKGSHRRRQMFWTPGLREHLTLSEQETTDEQIAEQELGGTTLLYVTKDAWFGVITRRRHLRALLLDLAEVDDDGCQLELALDCEGIGYHRPTGPDPGPPPLLLTR